MKLLSTKLYLPHARPGVVARPRLVSRLEQGLRGSVVVVAAGAGFGKTTLLAEGLRAWQAGASVAALPRAVAWVSLDAGDAEPRRFWGYVLAALGQAVPGVADSAAPLVEGGVIEPALVELVNACDQAPFELVLALDDYHTIAAPAVHTALAWLVDHLPANLHLVLAGRVEPPLPLGRWRVRGVLGEIRAADLRFSAEEASRFFAETMAVPLTGDQMAAVESYTEGWAAGLQLAGLSLQGRPDLARAVAGFTGSHRHVVDYLGDEVLARLPDATRDFLLRTAVLERMCAELCEVLLDPMDGVVRRPAAVLEELERMNLFLVPLDDERRWYRYHHLFADLLRHRLRQEWPALVAELHGRAARWFAERGLVPEAMHHALAASDHALTAAILADHRHRLVGDGEVATLSSWLDALPPLLLDADPRLAVTRAWVLQLQRQVSAITPLLDAAEAAMARGAGVAETTLGGELLTLRAFVAAEQGASAMALAHAEQALAQLPADAAPARSSALLILGHARYTGGDTAAALAVFAEASASCREAGNVIGSLFTAGEQVKLHALQGRLRTARQIAEEALGWARERHWDQLPPTSAVHIQLAHVLIEQGELMAAEEHLETAVGLTRRGPSITAARAQAFLARLRQTQGDRAGADEALDALASMVRRWDSRIELAYFAAYVARVRLLRGESEAAVAWAAGLQDWKADEVPAYVREQELLTLARVAVLVGDDAPQLRAIDTLALLRWLREEAHMAGRGGVEIEALALEALALERRGQTGQALEQLGDALALAWPERYLRTFADLGTSMARLITRWAAVRSRSAVPQGYLAALVAACEPRPAPRTLEAPGLDVSAAAPDTPALVEPLTTRERQVLQLFAAGLTAPEIAQELIVSINTVKSQLKSIYGKLDAHSRSEALARARGYGLIHR